MLFIGKDPMVASSSLSVVKTLLLFRFRYATELISQVKSVNGTMRQLVAKNAHVLVRWTGHRLLT